MKEVNKEAKKRVRSFKRKILRKSLSHWNYRLVKRIIYWTDPLTAKRHKDTSYGIHEAYYGRRENVVAVTIDPVRIIGFSYTDTKKVWKMMEEAFNYPILNYEEIVKKKGQGINK